MIWVITLIGIFALLYWLGGFLMPEFKPIEQELIAWSDDE
tara:strand:- start:510 stop:629 length:120 start_codon:yes stop_codon:yes gene_type:complete